MIHVYNTLCHIIWNRPPHVAINVTSDVGKSSCCHCPGNVSNIDNMCGKQQRKAMQPPSPPHNQGIVFHCAQWYKWNRLLRSIIRWPTLQTAVWDWWFRPNAQRKSRHTQYSLRDPSEGWGGGWSQGNKGRASYKKKKTHKALRAFRENSRTRRATGPTMSALDMLVSCSLLVKVLLILGKSCEIVSAHSSVLGGHQMVKVKVRITKALQFYSVFLKQSKEFRDTPHVISQVRLLISCVILRFKWSKARTVKYCAICSCSTTA